MDEQVQNVKIGSCRNRRTGYGVVLYRVTTNAANGAMVLFACRCAEHNAWSKQMISYYEARNLLHRPWEFCDKCKQMVESQLNN